MKLKPRHILLGAAVTLCSVAAAAQTSSETQELKSQLEALKKGQEAIQKDLVEIRKLLSQQRQPSRPTNVVPPNTVINLEGRPTKGAPGAQLAVIEFLDYQ